MSAPSLPRSCSLCMPAAPTGRVAQSPSSSRCTRSRGPEVEPDRATIWPYGGDGDPGEFSYARYAHPTGAAAEARLGALEGGEALLFSSGMGAETAVLLALAARGTT